MKRFTLKNLPYALYSGFIYQLAYPTIYRLFLFSLYVLQNIKRTMNNGPHCPLVAPVKWHWKAMLTLMSPLTISSAAGCDNIVNPLDGLIGNLQAFRFFLHLTPCIQAFSWYRQRTCGETWFIRVLKFSHFLIKTKGHFVFSCCIDSYRNCKIIFA